MKYFLISLLTVSFFASQFSAPLMACDPKEGETFSDMQDRW